MLWPSFFLPLFRPKTAQPYRKSSPVERREQRPRWYLGTILPSRNNGNLPDNAPHALVVDDDKRIRDLLTRNPLLT